MALFSSPARAFASATAMPLAMVFTAGGTRPRGGVVSVAAGLGVLLCRGLELVAAAAAAPAGGNNDDDDRERPVAFLGKPTELLEAASPTATDCIALMECLLVNEPVSPDVYQELLSAGRAFVVVEGQSKEGYLRADALVNAVHGLRLIDKTFFNDAKLSQYTLPVIPLISSEDLDKESYFRDLVNFFVLCYTTLYWEAYRKHGFDKRN